MPALLWGSSGNNPEERLSLGIYDVKELPKDDDAPFILLEGDDCEFIIIQEWLSEMLFDKTVDFVDNKIAVLYHKKG